HTADTIVVVRRHFYQGGNFAPAIAADGVGQIFSDVAGGVAEAVGENIGLGVEQQARRFASAGCHDTCFRVNALFGFGGFGDVRNGFGSAFFIDDNFARHSFSDQRELPGGHSWRQQNLAGAEIRSGNTTAIALATVVASQTAIVSLGENGKARRNAGDVEL